jgi:ATP-dependent DNA helicase RecG
VNLDELTRLVAGGESEFVEFKRSTGQRTAAMKAVCAMLNGRGGFVLFGVTDSGQIAGQDISTSTLEDVATEIGRIEPIALPDVETTRIENGKSVVALRIPGGGGPYAYDGRPYVRQGPTTKLMPQDRYQRLLLERTHGSHRWETQPAQGFSVDDLDAAEVVRTVDEAVRRQRMNEPGTRDIASLLLGLGLLYEDRPLNAAVALFGRTERLLPHYPQCLLRMARFRGETKSEFIDNRQEMGHAFDLFGRAQRFLRDHLPVAGRIVPNLFERIDDPIYPTEALREALANALCHRDYGVGGGAVSIAIYDDRLEIASTGPLPFGLTPADLAQPHSSRPWNPQIAQAFHRRGIIEAWGRGTIKMIELTQEAGLPPPEYDSSSGEFIVRFRPSRYIPPTRVGHDLTSLQRDILEVLAQLGPAPLHAIQQSLGTVVPRRTLQDNLRILRLLDIVELTGARRGAYWRLKSTDRT